MKVKIINCFDSEWWHSDYIGQVVEVEYWSHDAYFAPGVEEKGAVLPKRDCIVNGVDEIVLYTMDK